MSNLEPCPFCGSKNIDESKTAVMCDVCTAWIEIVPGSPADSRDHWNNRPIEEELRSELAKERDARERAEARSGLCLKSDKEGQICGCCNIAAGTQYKSDFICHFCAVQNLIGAESALEKEREALREVCSFLVTIDLHADEVNCKCEQCKDATATGIIEACRAHLKRLEGE
jgi:hypothetical protein